MSDVELTGRAAPPMVNGELVFEAPWQGRVFGMATELANAGVYTWDEFRAALIARIAAWERDATPGAAYPYYDCFLDALEGLLLERGVLRSDGLDDRKTVLAARPHGHDHRHDEDDHGH